MKKLNTIILIACMIWGFFAVHGQAMSTVPTGSESYVIGRINGTLRDLPGYFRNNPSLRAQGTDEVEIYGFRFILEESGKAYVIRPNRDGFFSQKLPPGNYTLLRKRSDRTSHKEPRTFEIFSFPVPAGTLVNIGTLDLVLTGEPDESLGLSRRGTKGTYIYRYHYQREAGEAAYQEPLTWFSRRKAKAAAALGNIAVRESTAPTAETDASKIVLQEIEPKWDR